MSFYSGFRTRRCDARRFAFHLAKVRGPWGIAQAIGFVLSREFEQPFQRSRSGVHPRVRITEFGEAFRDGKNGKVGWIAVGNLVPVKWRRYACVRQAGVQNMPNKWSDPWRSDCSPGKRRGAPLSTISNSPERVRGAR